MSKISTGLLTGFAIFSKTSNTADIKEPESYFSQPGCTAAAHGRKQVTPEKGTDAPACRKAMTIWPERLFLLLFPFIFRRIVLCSDALFYVQTHCSLFRRIVLCSDALFFVQTHCSLFSRIVLCLNCSVFRSVLCSGLPEARTDIVCPCSSSGLSVILIGHSDWSCQHPSFRPLFI